MGKRRKPAWNKFTPTTGSTLTLHWLRSVNWYEIYSENRW
jgi:hypothetical protein